MRCSFCGGLDLHGTHHPAAHDAAAVCVRCLAAIEAGLRGAPPGSPYTDVVSLVLVGRAEAPPVDSVLHFAVAPCGWCGRSDRGLPVAEMLGAVSLCATCVRALRQREASPTQESHYRQSAVVRADAPDAARHAIAGDRYRLGDAVLRRADPADDDALALADVQGIRVRAWDTQATAPWDGALRGTTTLLLAALVGAALRLAGLGSGHVLRLVALGLLTAFVGATVRRTLTRRTDERRLELLRPDGTTFLLAVDTATSEPAALVAQHARVLTAALAAMGRTPCPRFVHAPRPTGVRVAVDDRTEVEPSPAAPVRRRRA